MRDDGAIAARLERKDVQAAAGREGDAAEMFAGTRAPFRPGPAGGMRRLLAARTTSALHARIRPA
jgi:hypothetical protein